MTILKETDVNTSSIKMTVKMSEISSVKFIISFGKVGTSVTYPHLAYPPGDIQ